MTKRWVIKISLFLALQVVFMLIDTTIIEPKLNDIGYWMTEVAGPRLEWLTLYQSVFLKIITVLLLVVIVVKAAIDLIALRRKSHVEEDENEYFRTEK